MATSVRDLLCTIDDEAPFSAVTARQAADAAGALDELARALRCLATDGLDERVNGGREDITKDLAASCEEVAAAHVRVPDGRLTDLAGAVSDFIGRLRYEIGRDERWGITVELANTVRALSAYVAEGDGRRTAELAWTRLTARELVARSVHDAPKFAGQIILDRVVPARLLPAGLAPAEVAMESLAVISDRLRRVAARRAAAPTLPEIFAIARAAESTTRYTSAVAAALGSRPLPDVLPAVAIWYEIRDRLRPFYCGGPFRLQDRDLGRWAGQVHGALVHQFGPETHARGVTPRGPIARGAVIHLQTMINEIPSIADNLAGSIGHLADRGELYAVASELLYREDRLEQFLRRQPVVADRFDLEPAIARLGEAAVLAAELAVQLDHATGTGRYAQPAMVASHAARATAARSVDPHAVLMQQVPDGTTDLAYGDAIADVDLTAEHDEERSGGPDFQVE